MKKTIIVSVLTTIATMFLICLVCHLLRCHSNCGKSPKCGQSIQCGSSYGHGHFNKCASYSSCSSSKSCRSKCNKASSCAKATKCCKSKSSCKKGKTKTCKWASKDDKEVKIIKKKIVIDKE